MTRPNPALWLRYSFGGRLPDAYREWVLHDNTAPNWMLRYIMRIVVQALPVLVIAFVLLRLFTSVPVWTIIGVLVAGLLMSLFLTIGSARSLAKVRLARHGYSPEVEPPPSRLLPEDAGL